MSMLINRVAVAGVRGPGVNAIDIVGIAIVVVILAIAGDFAGIYPKIGGQILMCRANSCIDHSDNDISSGVQGFPPLKRANVRPRDAELAVVVQMP